MVIIPFDREESNERKDRKITAVQLENCYWHNNFVNKSDTVSCCIVHKF